MSFERPTLQTLINRAISDIETRLPGADARLRLAFENIIARALAGLAHGLHGHLVFLSAELLPDTGDADAVRRWAAILGVTVLDPSKSTGYLNVTGTNGTLLPTGTRWQRVDGELFETVGNITIAAGVGLAALQSVEARSAANTDGGTTLSIVSPISGINSSAVLDGNGMTGGADAESTDSVRARVLERLRTPPSGGGPGDYVAWAKSISGVTRAWEYPLGMGLGTVVVRFAVDGESSPIPSAAKVLEVQTYIDSVAPVTAQAFVVAPTANPMNPNIHIVPDTAAVRAAVTTELEALILRVSEPGGTVLLSQINEAISLATGETDHTLISPVADFTSTVNQLAVLGTITWS